MGKSTVFVASTPGLRRLVRNLFDGQSGFELVGNTGDCLKGLASLRRAPHLVVASVEPVKTGISRLVLLIKQAAPQSKLIVVCPTSELMAIARRSGADACLHLENLVFDLLPVVSRLVLRSAATDGRE